MTTVCPTSTQKHKKLNKNRGVAQLGARDIWDVEAAGSNPVTPTKNSGFDRKSKPQRNFFAVLLISCYFYGIIYYEVILCIV